MATKIEALSVVTGGFRARHSALRLAVSSARLALAEAGRRPKDVDLLVNAGLYRDGNLGEPALAPLIQDDIGANREDPHTGAAGTFSFDVANGVCGVLTALQVVDGFLRARTIETAAVVASDADPGRGLAPDFPFRPAGGAIVCRWAEDDRGLGPFRWCNIPDGGVTFRSTVGFDGGVNLLTIVEDHAFAEQAGRAAVEAATGVLRDSGLESGDVDLVVASPARPVFAKVLAEGLDIAEDCIVTDGPEMHTVAFVAALDRARREGRLSSGKTVLLVSGAAGITAGATIYHA